MWQNYQMIRLAEQTKGTSYAQCTNRLLLTISYGSRNSSQQSAEERSYIGIRVPCASTDRHGHDLECWWTRRPRRPDSIRRDRFGEVLRCSVRSFPDDVRDEMRDEIVVELRNRKDIRSHTKQKQRTSITTALSVCSLISGPEVEERTLHAIAIQQHMHDVHQSFSSTPFSSFQLQSAIAGYSHALSPSTPPT